MHVRPRSGALLLTLAAVLAALGLLALSPLARAAGTPDLSATVDSPRVLHGEAVPVRIAVTNPGPVYGYNLSYRVVLPPGVTYRGGAETAPQQIAGPGTGETTLIFSNLSDLSQSSTATLAFELDYDRARYDVGDSFDLTAQAFANDDPRQVPQFAPTASREPAAPAAARRC